MKKQEVNTEDLSKRSKSGAGRPPGGTNIITIDQSTAFPEIQKQLTKKGLNFSRSYIYRVLQGTKFNQDILRVAMPIIKKAEKERLQLQEQLTEHLSGQSDAA